MPEDNRATDFDVETMSFNYKDDWGNKNSLKHSGTLTIFFHEFLSEKLIEKMQPTNQEILGYILAKSLILSIDTRI